MHIVLSGRVNDKEIKILFDPGSCLTLLNYEFINENEIQLISNKMSFTTLTGNGDVSGLSQIQLTIGNISKTILVYVTELTCIDLVLGLDSIYKFNLNCDSKYQVTQNSGSECKPTIIKMIEPMIEINANFHIDYRLKVEHINNDIEFMKILMSNEVVFSNDKFDVGCFKDHLCVIELETNIPINSKAYRTSIEQQNRIENEIKSLMNAGLIRYSSSPYASPVTLAFKKEDNEKTRFCIDYRKLNEKVIPDKYPMPRIEDIIDNLYGNKFFSVFDVRSGFWHVRMKENDIQKTAFVTQMGHYEWLVMPFGYKNAPAIFQRAVRSMIEKHKLSRFCHNYIDDIIVYSPDMKTHLIHIEKLLNAMKNENVKLNFDKCKIGQLRVKYLGHELSLNEIRPLHNNVESILRLNSPKNVKEVRRFLGKVSYNRKFIPGITEILQPIYELLRKECKFDWNEKCEEAFNKIKALLTSEPVLKMFNPNHEIILETDASRIGIGAVLKQKDEKNELHPVGYFSKKLTNYQKNYPVTHLECLAVVESFKFWHHYLYDRRFTVITDHSALKSIKKMNKPGNRLFTWAFFLAQYDFEIKYRPGKENDEADFLSRNPIMDFELESPLKLVNFINIDELKDEQMKMKMIVNENNEAMNSNGVIVKIDKNGKEKMIVPENLRIKIIKIVHEQFGHVGIRKMIDIITWIYTWKNLTNDVIDYVSNCNPCQLGKTRRQKLVSEFGHFGPPKASNEIISIDTVCGLSGYKSKKGYMHLAVDHFTRYVWAIAADTQHPSEFIKLMNKVNQIKKPKLILADRFTSLTSRTFNEFLKSHDIEIDYIPKSAPQCNGICERVCNSIIDRIRVKMISANYRYAWVRYLQRCIDEYNDTPHSVTKFTPNYLMHGIIPRNCENAEFPPLDEATKSAYENSISYHQKNKIVYEQKHVSYEYKDNDYVYMKNLMGINKRKLDPMQLGPFRIQNRFATNIYNVVRSESPLIIEQVHSKHLFPVKNGQKQVNSES